MFDSKKVIAGLIIFFVFVTFPIWYNFASSAPAGPPTFDPIPGESKCVEDTQWMRAWHMDLLNFWRDDVVRTGNRTYKSTATGKTYNKSLTNTCLECHGSFDKFCDKCHQYSGVETYCFECHIPEREKK